MKNLERIVFLVFLIYPVRFLVSATIDENRQVLAFNQERVWIASGNFETYVAYGFYITIFFLLIVYYSRAITFVKFSFFEIGVFTAFFLGIIYNLNRWPVTEVIGIFFFFFIFLAIKNQRLSPNFLGRLIFWHMVIVSLIIVFPIFNSNRSFSPCTSDKCSILGSLFTSFFPHENALALFLLIGSIFFLARKGVWGYFLVSVHGILILFTGSKLAISVFFVIVLLSFFNTRILYASIWCVAVFSAFLFFARLDPNALTGRGMIFSIGRNYFYKNVFFGYGYGALIDASLSAGEISYRVSHEHNGMGALLVRHGFFGALGISAYLLKVGLDLAQKLKIQILLLLGLVLTFPTEANSDFSVQNYLAWVYLVVIANIGSSEPELFDNPFNPHKSL